MEAKVRRNENGRSSKKINPSMTQQQDQHGLALSKNSLCSNREGIGRNSTKIRSDRKGGLASSATLLLVSHLEPFPNIIYWTQNRSNNKLENSAALLTIIL
jgi:hypothetical protein